MVSSIVFFGALKGSVMDAFGLLRSDHTRRFILDAKGPPYASTRRIEQ